MHHAVHLVAGVRVRGGPRCFNASTLVDGHIDDNRALLHVRHHGAGDDFWRGSAGNQHAADDEVGLSGGVGNVVAVGCKREDAAVEDVVDFAKAVEVQVDQRDLGTETQGDLGSIRTDYAAADDGDVRG